MATRPRHDPPVRVMTRAAAYWRADIDSLSFQPQAHTGQCVTHRRAFRALLGIEPEPKDCLTCFSAHRDAFERAAAAKIGRASLAEDAHFHLTSRDLVRAGVPRR